MAKIHAMLDIGKRSMMNSQTALQTVSHNIANKATEGYSRQRVDMTTADPVSEGRLQMGMGTRAAMVTRTNNPYLEKQLQKEQGLMGFQNGRTEGLSRVEQIFNEQANKGLNQYITDFFNAFRELSNTPESTTTRTIVKEAAEALTLDFKRVHNQLTDVQNDLDGKIKSNIEEVNKMAKEIGSLNEKIASVEIQGVPANDERDRRDVLLKRINEKIDIHYAEGNNGMISISTAGNALLVSGFDSYELQTYRDPETERLQIQYTLSRGSEPINVTSRIRGGDIGGALTVRDNVINDLKEKVNGMAYALADEVNSIHIEGYDRKGNKGLEFFKMPVDANKTAAEIEVNEDIVLDINRIAVAARPGAVGDNTVANVISQLQYQKIMDDGSTIDDFYNAQVGRVGVIAQRAVKSKESQENILNQLGTLRESISGVSLDEETTKMLEFQKAFEASARVIRTADEMFDTILSLKRM